MDNTIVCIASDHGVYMIVGYDGGGDHDHGHVYHGDVDGGGDVMIMFVL